MLKDAGMNISAIEANPPTRELNDAPPTQPDCDLSSQLVSESATRGIFEWLRSTGYPVSEKSLYQHSWIGCESSEEEDDIKSDIAKEAASLIFVDKWLSEAIG